MPLSPATPHSDEGSQAIGTGALVRSAAGDATYRLRILGDSVALNDDGVLGSATVTFDYEPVP